LELIKFIPQRQLAAEFLVYILGEAFFQSRHCIFTFWRSCDRNKKECIGSSETRKDT